MTEEGTLQYYSIALFEQQRILFLASSSSVLESSSNQLSEYDRAVFSCSSRVSHKNGAISGDARLDFVVIVYGSMNCLA